MKNSNPTTTQSWQKLKTHFEGIKDTHLKTLFEQSPSRADDFAITWKDFYVDYSKHRIDAQTKDLLIALAKEVGLSEAIVSYFGGVPINATEGRAVQHTALRDKGGDAFAKAEVDAVKAQIKTFTDAVINGDYKGATGQQITDVVNIGIGGSDLGPMMVTEALAFYKNHLKLHYISNVDGDHVWETIKPLNPETTLFVIVSKTFTTQETLSNATTVRRWFVDQLDEAAIAQHFVAVSTNLDAISEFGIASTNVFPMWNWVGGRFSLWSSVGLSIALGVGYSHFEALLEGAYEMDVHFKEQTFDANIPVLLALLSVWYNNFFKAESQAVIPYTQYLHRLPAYLQQAIMESNGKSVDRNGNTVDYETGTIIWGEPGTNAQHAFFQLIHQGTKLIPADFIGYRKPLHGDFDHHQKLMANYIAQTEALMNGKTEAQVIAELEQSELSQDARERLTPFKVFNGNKPTTTILIDQLTPRSLGALIAMYEHKIFVEGVIWNIYSYDQWGVELGKQLANKVLSDFTSSQSSSHDVSTQNLIDRFR